MNRQTLFPGAMLSSTACSIVYNVLSIVAVAVVPTKSKGLAGQYSSPSSLLLPDEPLTLQVDSSLPSSKLAAHSGWPSVTFPNTP